jgi:hypothetical protein
LIRTGQTAKFMNGNRYRVMVAVLMGLVCATPTLTARAQTANESSAHTSRGFGPVYDTAHELTLDGTIQAVVTEHEADSPPGIHLLVSGPGGVTDAHVGSFLSEQTKAALLTGAQVQMVGAILSLQGKDYLLVRQMTVGGRSVTLRSKHGVLVHERPVVPQASVGDSKTGVTVHMRSGQ